MFKELVIKNTPVKKLDCLYFYGRFSPASWTNLIMGRQDLSSQSNFPIKLYYNSNFGFLVNLNFVLST